MLRDRAGSYSRGLEYRDFGQRYVVHPAARILESPSRYLGQALASEKDDEAAGAARVLGHARTAGILLENRADRVRIREVYRDAFSMDAWIRAGEIFTRDGFTGAGSIFQEAGRYSIIDPEKVTVGDLKMFRYRTVHPEASMEELLEIRERGNRGRADGGRIPYKNLGRHNRLRRQADRIVDVSEIRAFMEYGRRLGEERPDLFTPEQRRMLGRKGSILQAGNRAELEAGTALVRQILKAPFLAGEQLSGLDPEGRMAGRDAGRLLEGRIPGMELVKAGKNVRPGGKAGSPGGIILGEEQYHLVRGGLKALQWNQENCMRTVKLQQKLAARDSLGKLAVTALRQGMEEDEEFAGMSGYASHAVPLGTSAARTGAGVLEVAGRAVEKAGEISGRAAAAGLYASRNEVAAEALRTLGETIGETGKRVRNGADHVVHAPERLARKGGDRILAAAEAGARVLGSRLEGLGRNPAAAGVGRAAARSPVYRGMKKAGRGVFRGVRAGNKAAGAVFRFSGMAVDFVKNGILRPAAIFMGAVLLLQMVLAALSGGAGGGSSVAVAVLDTPVHFTNPAFAAPEEMGFQQQYEQSQARFQGQIDGIIHGMAETLDRKGRRIPYGVSGGREQEDGGDSSYSGYANGVTLHFDSEKSNNLEDILSCLAVVMMQQQADHHREALELVDCFYRSSHTYDYTETPLYDCISGCETTHYFCGEVREGYPGTDMRFSPWLHGEPGVPEEDQECEVDRKNPDALYSTYAGCTVTGTCFHNSGSDGDHFGRRKPGRGTCSRPEAYYDCTHSCSRDTCSHDCSRSAVGCGGYWYCGGHDHFGCPEGHDVQTCSGHVNIRMNIHMKDMEELFGLGGVGEGVEESREQENREGERGQDSLPDPDLVENGLPAGVGFGMEMVQGEEIWMGWTIFESGNVGYGQAGGDGGRAYGRYQFDYRYALPEFLRYAVSMEPEACTVLAKYTGYRAGSEELLSSAGLGADWVRAYTANRNRFAQLQDDFAYSRYYVPAKQALAARGIDLDAAGDPVVKGTVYSLAVRDGATDSGVRAAWQSYTAGEDTRAWLEKLYSLEARRHPGQAGRWDSGQKTAALNGATTGYLKDLGSVLTADGAVYQDHVKGWISRYPALSREFKRSGGWCRDNREWAMALRGAGDWYEIYGIRGGSLDFASATSGGVSMGDPGVCAESLCIPDNGGSMPVVYMSQGGGQPWGSLPFGGGTVATSGCSVTCLAMVLSYLKGGVDPGGWVYPSDIVASIAGKYGSHNYFYTSGGQKWDIFPAVAGIYGVSCRQISTASIADALAAGHPVVMSCRPGEFTSAGHFIVLSGLTEDGYVVVNDPNPAHASYSYKKYTVSYLAGCGKGWWAFSDGWN